MSTSSSEESSRITRHDTTSSGLESTGSLLSSLPSDSSDSQTEITPPTSPASYEGKTCTPCDILDASRRLGYVSAEDDGTPTKSKQFRHHRVTSKSVVNDEAGYDADGDGDGEGDGDTEGGQGSSLRVRAGPILPTHPTAIRRPAFLRIDTRQQRRVASMLATPTRRPSSDADPDVPTDPYWHSLRKFPSLTPIRSKTGGTAVAKAPEYLELRRRGPPELVGLGIGFPENHPLRGRAFTMPVCVSPIADHGPGLEDMLIREHKQEQAKGQDARGKQETGTRMQAQAHHPDGRFSWLSSPIKWEKATQREYASSPVRLPVQSALLEVSELPIDIPPTARSSKR